MFFQGLCREHQYRLISLPADKFCTINRIISSQFPLHTHSGKTLFPIGGNLPLHSYVVRGLIIGKNDSLIGCIGQNRFLYQTEKKPQTFFS